MSEAERSPSSEVPPSIRSTNPQRASCSAPVRARFQLTSTASGSPETIAPSPSAVGGPYPWKPAWSIATITVRPSSPKIRCILRIFPAASEDATFSLLLMMVSILAACDGPVSAGAARSA